MIREYHRLRVEAPASRVYREFSSLGGEHGWPSMHWAYEVRGILDQMVGGEGMRSGRRHPSEIQEGDQVDFWRVEAVQPDRLLRLRAEMRMPGAGWLEFRVEPVEKGVSILEQTALFDPRGFWGHAYWYSLYPFHSWIFRRMIRKLARRAELAS